MVKPEAIFVKYSLDIADSVSLRTRSPNRFLDFAPLLYYPFLKHSNPR